MHLLPSTFISADVGSSLDQLLPEIAVSDAENASISKRVRHLNDLAKVSICAFICV